MDNIIAGVLGLIIGGLVMTLVVINVIENEAVAHQAAHYSEDSNGLHFVWNQDAPTK